jgi:hypothetical protein
MFCLKVLGVAAGWQKWTMRRLPDSPRPRGMTQYKPLIQMELSRDLQSMTMGEAVH